ncbi:MAG TPA: hypothetical protein VGD63_01670 [Steroidobacteraceae bacterium]
MSKTLRLALLVCCSFSASAKAPDPAASRIAAQNALFEEQYESDLKSHPDRATAVGDYRFNDQLDDYSPAGFQRQHDTDESFLARLKRYRPRPFRSKTLCRTR